MSDDVDRSLLLAVEGVRIDDSTDTRANLMAALARNPALIGSTRGDGTGFISAELSPDGEVMAVGRAWIGLSFYSTSTGKVLGSYDAVTAWRTDFNPAGHQLAVAAQDTPGGGLGGGPAPVPRPAVRLVDTTTFKDEPIQLGGTPDNIYPETPRYSADGRFLAVPFGASVLVWDLTSRQEPIQRVSASGAYPGVALSPDGSVLYVGTTSPPKVTMYDVVTGGAIGSADVPGWLLQVSPDGSILAAVASHEIVLLDTATLTERARLQGHTNDVQDLQFSHHGDLLVSGANDRTSIVWDVATGEQREQLRGHFGSVWGLDISPDDRTLYTAGLDGALLTWDLLGDRRWIRHLPLTAPLTHADQAVRGSPTGDAVVYISYADSIQFVDLATGRAGPMIDTGRYEFGNWAWRPDGSQLATAGAGTPEPALDRDRLPDRRSKPHRGRVARRASHPPVPGELPIAQRALNSDTWHGSDRRPARFT